jgi:hypothetical protein
MQTMVLWLFVMNLGVAFGAGLYEHRIVASRWMTFSPDGGAHWHADQVRRDDPGRRFWAFATTIPLTLLTLANLYAAWHAEGPVQTWWLAAAVLAFGDRALTFAYFIPTMVGLMKAADSSESVRIAMQWWQINYLRHALVLAAWLASLRTFALFCGAR